MPVLSAVFSWQSVGEPDRLGYRLNTRQRNQRSPVQNTYDVIIIGSGIVGVSTAWHLRGIGFAGSIAIIERDPSFSHSSTAHAIGGIWQQFSLKENIQMSLYGARFLKEFAKDQNVDLDFQEHGYLFLAEAENLEALQTNVARQRKHKADIAPLTPALLQQHFPWLNTDGLAGGALGLSNEGWFDAHRLHSAMRSAVRDWDVSLIKASIAEIDHADTEIRSVMLDNGRRLKCGHLVNATGPNAGILTQMARIRLPVEPRKRSIFVVHGKSAPSEMPVLVDPSGVFLRPEGPFHICGVSPGKTGGKVTDQRCLASDFEPDLELFETIIKPTLESRLPDVKSFKVVRAWAGHYDHNSFDQIAVLGPHTRLANFYFANGFSGIGLQQAPAAGRAVAELILHGAYQTLDLSRLGFERIVERQPLEEENLI